MGMETKDELGDEISTDSQLCQCSTILLQLNTIFFEHNFFAAVCCKYVNIDSDLVSP